MAIPGDAFAEDEAHPSPFFTPPRPESESRSRTRDLKPLIEKLRAEREARDAANRADGDSPRFDPELIPDLGDSDGYQPTEQEAEQERLVRDLDIIDAYNRWCGKSAPRVGGNRNGIMISCLRPDHPDRNPSASINLDRQVWFCHACCEGGDIFDIAAYHFGYSVPGYKTDGTFGDLMDDMACSLGRAPTTGLAPPAVALPSSVPASSTSSTSAPTTRRVAPIAPGGPGAPVGGGPAPDPLADIEPALLGIAGELVRAVDPISEAHPMAVLAQFMVAFGNLVGHGPFVMIGDTPHHTNEYCVIVGNSAKARKGTSWAPVHRVLAAVDSEWSAERVVEGVSSGEGLVHALRDPTYVEEDDPSGTPTRKLVEPGVSDKRLLCQESEFGSVLKVTSRNGNTVSPRIRTCWDSGRMQVLTKHQPLRATNAHMSMVGHSTSTELTTLLSKTDMVNGFANRFIWIHVHRSKRLSRPRPIPERVVRDMADRLTPVVDAAKARTRVELSEEAESLWDQLYDQFPDGDRRVDVIAARAEAHVLRLALIYALLDTSEQIEPRHLEAAMVIWWYSWDSALTIFGEGGAGSLESKVHDLLRTAGTAGVSRGELTRALRHEARAGDIGKALAALEADRTARSETSTSTGGRPETRWFLV